MAWNLNKKDGFNLGMDQSEHQRATEFMRVSRKLSLRKILEKREKQRDLVHNLTILGTISMEQF